MSNSIQLPASTHNVFAVLHVEGNEKPAFCGPTTLPIHNEAELRMTVMQMFPQVRKLALAVFGGSGNMPDYMRANGGLFRFSETEKAHPPELPPMAPIIQSKIPFKKVKPKAKHWSKGKVIKVYEGKAKKLSPKRGHSTRKKAKRSTKRR
jgi:hypothetical protein